MVVVESLVADLASPAEHSFRKFTMPMTQKEQRRRLGTNDFDIEDELDDEATATVVEGAKRSNRKWPELIATGFVGGVDVGLGILAMILVKQATGSDVLAGLAFGMGLLALKLAHSELFTEEFLLPLNAVIAGQATWLQGCSAVGGYTHHQSARGSGVCLADRSGAA